MDDEKLHEIGGKLDVSQRDIKSLERLQKREKQVYRIHKKTARILKKISIALGLTYGAIFVALDEAAYPYGPDYPGGPLVGRLLPIIGFGAGATTIGFWYSKFGGRSNHPSSPLSELNGLKGGDIKTIGMVVKSAIIAFTMYYIFSYITISWFTASLYGVYTQEEGTSG